MKKYTKPSMTIAKFGSKEEIANGSLYAEYVTTTSEDGGMTSVYEIKSLSASS